MAKENQTLALYRANRERTRKAADSALTKAVAAVTKKAGGVKPTKPTVEELPPSGDQPPAGDAPGDGHLPDFAMHPPAGDPAK